jgi:glutathione S-transferase
MLTLYHYWSSVCSQKARLCLAEKRLDWQSRHIDLFKFENYRPWYAKLNPKAVVPTLEHHGHVVIESNVILEYLEDQFPEVRLRPDDLTDRAQMRLWMYNSEELAHANVNTCSHNLRHARRLQHAGIAKDDVLRAADHCPNPMIGRRLRRRMEIGVSPEEEDDAYANLDYMLDQMETRLGAAPWLAGSMFSLADLAMAPMVNRIEVLARPEMISAARRPGVAEWWQRVQTRPAFKEAFAFRNPDANDPLER